MGGGKSGSGKTTIRYAGYIEEKHKALLNEVVVRRNAIIDSSPYANISAVPVDDGFFGVGCVLTSFPSLYNMYGKYLAGLNTKDTYDDMYSDIMEGGVAKRLASAEATFLSDELKNDAIPRFELGMRDMNAVMSSTFVIGKALLEETRLKAVEKYSAGLQYSLLPLVNDAWKTRLEWSKAVVLTYAEVMKLYYVTKLDVEQHNQEVQAKHKLWPFTILDFERATLSALQGATNTRAPMGSGGASRALGGALSGAAAGAMVGGPPGAIIGGVIGLASGLL